LEALRQGLRLYSVLLPAVSFLIALTFPDNCFGQQNKIDSLSLLLKTAKQDTQKVMLLCQRAESHTKQKEFSEANASAEDALRLSKSLNFKKGMARSYYELAAANSFNDTLRLQYLFKASEILAKPGIDDRLQVITHLSIGQIHIAQKNFSDMLKNLQIALKTAERIKDSVLMAKTYSNIGNYYSATGNIEKQLEYYLKGLAIVEKKNDKKALAIILGNMGDAYAELKNYPKSIESYERSIALFEELKSKEGLALRLASLAKVYYSTGKKHEAYESLQKAYALARETHYSLALKESLEGLSDYYEKEKDFKNAFITFKNLRSFTDSLYNSEKATEVTKLQYQFDAAQAAKIKKLEEEKLEAERRAKEEQQKIILYSISTGFILVLALAFFIFRGYRQKQKANLIISAQKKILEEKNKDITDSINYARRIQEAILPDKEIKYRIFPDAFVLFQPRDVVSGDFYWFSEKNGKRIIAAADCTGHGVPGAFMSMIGNSFLNEIVNERGITRPSEILNELRHLVIKSLKQKEESGSPRDGMDISLLCFSENHVEWAGANNPLWIVHNGNLTAFAPDKQPIGLHHGENLPFTNHKISPEKGSSLYIFSDGYADQFGGAKGKKFREKQLKELLLSIQMKSMQEQEEVLLSTFQNWKGELEQIDDVLVIGVRI
jgi:serine phosphatase RsbU (regulator of sigma subunit)